MTATHTSVARTPVTRPAPRSTVDDPARQRVVDEALAVVSDTGFATVEDLLFEVNANPTAVIGAMWHLVETGQISHGSDGILRSTR